MAHAAPSVDVVITTNRAPGYIREAVASVEAQTFSNWRLIIVDDGSPDPAGLDSLAAGCSDAVVFHEPPSGLPAGRNVGIRASTAEFIAFLDDDDIWRPDKLELQVGALRQNPDALGVFSGGWYLDAQGVKFGSGWPAFEGTRDQFLGGAVPLPRITTLIASRAACLRIGGFDPSLSLGEDHDFTLRLLQVGNLVGVDEQLVGYRRHESNMSGNGWLEEARAMEGILGKLIADARERGDSCAEEALRGFVRQGRVRQAFACPPRVAHELRKGRPMYAISYAVWCLRKAPRSTLRAFIVALGGRGSA